MAGTSKLKVDDVTSLIQSKFRKKIACDVSCVWQVGPRLVECFVLAVLLYRYNNTVYTALYANYEIRSLLPMTVHEICQ